MPFEIKMPQLGLTMESGTVVRWLIAEGEPVAAQEPLLEVETDKAVVPVEAAQGGVLARILVPAGAQAPVGTTLAVLVAAGEALPAGWQPSDVGREAPPAPQPEPSLPARAPGRAVEASWKARALARRLGIDLAGIEGSGPGGRVVAADVARAQQARAAPCAAPAGRASPLAARLAESLGLDLATVSAEPQGRIMEEDVLRAAAAIIRRSGPAPAAPVGDLPQVAQAKPLEGVRAIVSARMAESAHATARVTMFREVDASALVALRTRFQARGLSVSYNDILARLAALALLEHPTVNARLGEGQIEMLDRVNIGLAVDSERGLLVPVIRNAHLLSIAQIAEESARLIAAARSGRIAPDDLTGGTFTISNLGMLGVDGFTPVINLPECAILGVGRIRRKPVVLDAEDTVAVRPMMTISLAFDHRVIDGVPTARFLDHIAQSIEDPLLALI
jgi:pyruvate dehydrogenase E2 component (dihydrolipoamide acetyltransferase)